MKIEESERSVSFYFRNGQLRAVVYLEQGDNSVYVVGFEKQA